MDHDGHELKKGAERQRRYRRRKRDGSISIPAGSLEASAVMSEALIEAGWLDAMDAENSVAVAEAVARLHVWWLARYGADTGVTL